VPVLVSEVVRGKALALVLERAKVVDESGRPVDLEALREDAAGDELLDVAGVAGVADDGIDHTGHDHD
jgi:trigger factor